MGIGSWALSRRQTWNPNCLLFTLMRVHFWESGKEMNARWNMCVFHLCTDRFLQCWIEVSFLYAAKIQYSTPLLRKYMADLWWVLKLKQRIYLFSLLLLPLLALSFSFFPLPCFLGETLDPKNLWKSVSSFVFSNLVSFSAHMYCSSIVVGTKVCSGEEAA